MKIILKEDVKKIGKAGELITVSDGYARNFLFPRDLAVEATPSEMKKLKQKQDVREQKQQKLENDAKKAADRLKDTVVQVRVKVGESGKLYGSVTNKDIADAIKESTGFDIDKRKIELKEQVKTIGEHTAHVRLHQDVAFDLRFKVVE